MAEGTATADLATSEALQTQDTFAAQSGPAAGEANKAGPVRAASPLSANQPVPMVWIITLAVLMLVCAAVAWLLRVNNDRRIRREWNRK